jgi:ubiquitin carboxyl-terminal hydrolase 34
LEKNINENNNNNEKEEDINAMKDMIIYCILCLQENNNKSFQNITNIISELKTIKDKEDKEEKNIKQCSSSDICQILDDKKISFKYLERKKDKKIEKFVGIRNLGNLCYMNSVIQQLFMILQFKYSILDANDNKDHIKTDYLEDDNTLHQLQKLFTYLLFTSYGEVIPKDFILSIKDSKNEFINPQEMQDSQEFFSSFCDKIENSLDNTKYKYLIENLFIGKICYQNICTSCKKINYRFEDFKNLTLEIHNLKDIYESLNKYIEEETIEDYKCENCSKKGNLKKRQLLSNLPNILVIHLKRMIFNLEGKQEKINSRFEFPIKLNLKKYCIENIVKEKDNINIYKKKMNIINMI